MLRFLLPLFLLLTFSCRSASPRGDENLSTGAAAKAKAGEWTILLYAAGDDEVVRKATYYGLKRIEKVRGLNDNDQVRVVVQHDDVGDDPNFRYLLRPSSSPTRRLKPDSKEIPEHEIRAIDPSFRYGEKDSGHPGTLKKFLSWAVQAYPARHYVLILSGHSWGPQGHMQDYFVDGKVLDDSTMIKNYELRRVMEELFREQPSSIPRGKFDLLFVDGCVSGQMEVPFEVKDQFDYFAASSLETPYYAIPYDKILEPFVAKVKENPRASEEVAARILENDLLIPLSTLYVKAHGPRGSLAKLEGEASITTSFSIRMKGLDAVAAELSEFVDAFLKTEGASAWRQGRIRSVDRIVDVDGHVDMLQFSKNMQTYLEEKFKATGGGEWKFALEKARAIEKSLGYGVSDPATETTRVAHASAVGAWVHMEVDSTSKDAELVTCNAVKSFAKANASVRSAVPTFSDPKGKPVDPKDIWCSEYPAERGGTKVPPPVSPNAPYAITEFFKFKTEWPHGIDPYLTEITGDRLSSELEADTVQRKIDQKKIGRRILSIWIDRGNAQRLEKDLILRVAGTRFLDIDYLSGSPKRYIEKQGNFENLRVATTHLDVPAYVHHSDPKLFAINGTPGLYVAEAHSNGSLFKQGLGIFAQRKFSGETQYYMKGRNPVDRIETTAFSLPLEKYFEDLAKQGRLGDYPLKERSFYDAHRIAQTGWSDFLFGN